MREFNESFADADKLLDLFAQNRFHTSDAITQSEGTALAKPPVKSDTLTGMIDVLA